MTLEEVEFVVEFIVVAGVMSLALIAAALYVGWKIAELQDKRENRKRKK